MTETPGNDTTLRKDAPWPRVRPGADTDGSRVHCYPFNGLGTRLYPCGIAMITPQSFIMASQPKLLRPG